MFEEEEFEDPYRECVILPELRREEQERWERYQETSD